MAIAPPKSPAPKAAPKAVAPAPKAKAAPPPAAKPAAPKAAAPAAKPAAKPVAAAPAKAAAPAAKAAPPAAAGGSVSKKDFDEFVEAAAQEMGAMKEQIKYLTAKGTGYEGYVTIGDDYVPELNIDKSTPQEILSEWCWLFGYNHEGTQAQLIDRLTKEKQKPGFKGFKQVNTGPMPGSEAAAEAASEEAPAEEEEAAGISEEDINGMNWQQLVDLITENGADIPYKDISKPPQPKVLRKRVIEALAAAAEEAPAEEEAAEEEAAAEGEEEEGVSLEDLPVGTPIYVTVEGEQQPAYSQGLDADGDVIFNYGEGQENYSIAASEIEGREEE